MPVVEPRESFEHLSAGRWGRFADWVRSIHPMTALNSLSFASLFLNEQLLELIEGHLNDRLDEDSVLMCCYDILRGVVMTNLAYGYHLRVFYNSRNMPLPPFRPSQYMQLIKAIKSVTSAAMIYAHM